MTSELENWAVVERTFIEEEIKFLKAGARLVSPSGDDITEKKLEQLGLRLEHANKVILKQNDS